MNDMQVKVASQTKKVTAPTLKNVLTPVSKKKEESSESSSESESEEDEVSCCLNCLGFYCIWIIFSCKCCLLQRVMPHHFFFLNGRV